MYICKKYVKYSATNIYKLTYFLYVFVIISKNLLNKFYYIHNEVIRLFLILNSFLLSLHHAT